MGSISLYHELCLSVQMIKLFYVVFRQKWHRMDFEDPTKNESVRSETHQGGSKTQ